MTASSVSGNLTVKILTPGKWSSETKLGDKKLEVVEILIPLQWRLYQIHIANLWNVCYLDAPTAYMNLDKKFPRIGVSTVGDLLVKGGRLDELLTTHGVAAS
jgi:hypothetical protein